MMSAMGQELTLGGSSICTPIQLKTITEAQPN